MKTYQMERRQILPMPLERAWEFFSNPYNLKEITPEYLGMDIVHCDSGKIYSGMILEYTVQPLLNIKTTWLSEIKHVDEPFMFVDEQKIGPYKLWYHIHTFKALGQGVEVTDTIFYALPGGPLSGIINRLIVEPKLNYIFNYRREIIDRKFGTYHAQLQ